MYLIKAELDRRQARGLLADCQQMHRFITGFFGTNRQDGQILYRTNLIQNKLCIYIYSQMPAAHIPDNCALQQRDVTLWLDGMEAGQLWSFDLIAAPTKKVISEGKKNSRRRILRQPQERQEWLERKAEQNGFVILHAQEQEQLHVSGRHQTDKGGVMYHDAYHYQGVLQITAPEAFRRAMQTGIGSGKAYGFGMMMVKRV
ncbi:MAG: type I-E CRISPR-associated protein Cas6/Cse3/CasE [Oscillospiraceae bacterium]|nr:type I-E CRISPR-associated protein Cas6/Cse3/CasE [Oscillospiraceae bacterium]